MSKFNAVFLPIAFTALIIVCGVYYYQKNNEGTSSLINSSGGQASILGTNTNTQAMSNYNEYMVKVLDVRTPINKGIEDLMSKTKYTTLFDKDTMIKQANEIKTSIETGIKTLKSLNLSTDLEAINKKQMYSLELLNEAMSAYIAFQNTDNETEKKKQSELMSYKIDDSNNQIKDITSSSSGSTNSNNINSDSINVGEALQ